LVCSPTRQPGAQLRRPALSEGPGPGARARFDGRQPQPPPAIAIEAGELSTDTDSADIAFQLNALAAAASYGFQLSRDPEVFARARRSMRRALGA
jgi:hypothetical protein